MPVALINTDTLQIVREWGGVPPSFQFGPANAPTIVMGADVGYTVGNLKLVAINVTDPGFDPNTQVALGVTDTVSTTQVARVYSYRAKTQAELDADKDASVSNADKTILNVVFDLANMVRALQTPAKPPLSKAQFITYVKAQQP
jgi:hypothetical protein